MMSRSQYNHVPEFRESKPCPRCGGEGAKWGEEWKTCPVCLGTGNIAWDFDLDQAVPCPNHDRPIARPEPRHDPDMDKFAQRVVEDYGDTLDALGKDNHPLTDRELLHKWFGGLAQGIADRVGTQTLLDIARIIERRRPNG